MVLFADLQTNTTMGKKKMVDSSRKRGGSKYEKLTILVDQLLKASTQTPVIKELESSCAAICELVEQIRSLESAPESAPESAGTASSAVSDGGTTRTRESKLTTFMSWCNENGVKSDKVELAMFDGLGVGVRATQHIQCQELFMSIPRSVMLTVDPEISSIGQLLKSDPIASRMPNVGLALHLLSERFKGSASQWKPYLDVLPDVYDTSLYYTPDEIALLKGSSTYEQSIHLQRNIARQYAYFWSLFVNQSRKYPKMAARFTFDFYRWAVSTVMTRQNIIPSVLPAAQLVEEEKVACLALIPLWDMCNHKEGQMLTDYEETANECRCYANEACVPGDQVYICYGTRANSDFLVHNGFVDEGNSNNAVVFKIGLAKTDALIDERRTVLTKHGISADSQVFHLRKQSDLPQNLLLFLQVFNATQDELQDLLTRDDQCSAHLIISEENERKCWSFLKVRCGLLLRTYTANMEVTDAARNTRHIRMALQLIAEEKEILSHVMRLCDSKQDVRAH